MLFPESNNWRAGMQDVSAAIDDTFGEIVTVTPVLPGKPNFPSTPQPERAVTVTAVFTSPHKRIMMGDFERVDRPLPVSTSEPSFSFGRDVLPFPVRQGYRIQVCRTGEVFEAKDQQSDGVARIVVPVVQLGRQSEKR